MVSSGEGAVDVFLADDNLIVEAGRRALIDCRPALRVVSVAADYDGGHGCDTAAAPAWLGGEKGVHRGE